MSIRAYRDIHPAQVAQDPGRQGRSRRRCADHRADHDQHDHRRRPRDDRRRVSGIEEAGADIVRVSCPDEESTKAMKTICKAAARADRGRHPFPLQARHRSGGSRRRLPAHQSGQYRLGARVREVVQAAKDHGCSMRIGVNAGSLEKDLLEKYGEPCPEAMVESALRPCQMLEDNDFFEFKISREGVRRVPRGRRLSAARRCYATIRCISASPRPAA